MSDNDTTTPLTEKTPSCERFFADNSVEDIVPLLKLAIHFPMDPRFRDNVSAAIWRIADLEKQLADARRDKERYYDLIYCVVNKYPDETRHETAKRYILEAEQCSGTGDAAMKEAAE